MNIFLICVLLVGESWTKTENGCDLKLASIFRTPKDFSRSNFDHFEILERNNFENKDANTGVTGSSVERNPHKSVANAQVSLRIGGDDIHDCNGFGRPYPGKCDVEFVRPLPCERSLPLLSPYSKPWSHSYPQYSSTPYASPGYIYGSSSLPVHSLPSYSLPPCYVDNEQLIPATKFIETETVVKNDPTETLIKETLGSLDVGIENTDLHSTKCDPAISESTEVIENIIPIRESNLQDNPEIIQETIVDNVPVSVTLDKASNDIKPCPEKVSYVEVNLADAPKSAYESVEVLKGIDPLLDQALIPFTSQQWCQYDGSSCSEPLGNELTIRNDPYDDLEGRTCSYYRNQGPCDSCNYFRNPRIPYGKRFSKDLDSLLEAISPNLPLRYIPPNLYHAKFEEKPLKTWSPFSYLSQYFPNFIGPCSTPVAPTTASNLPSTSCVPEVIEVKNESPCLEKTNFKEVVNVANPLEYTVVPPNHLHGKCENRPLNKFSPFSFFAQYFPNFIPPCSIPFAPTTTTFITPSNCPSTSCASEVVEVKNESPCLETTNVKEVVEEVNPVEDTIIPYLNPYDYKYGRDFNHLSEFSKVFLNGHELPTGPRYYSDPYKTVAYKQPTLWNAITPITEITEYVDPTPLPNYEDICDVDTLPIAPEAEVIPATNYLCNECNKSIPSRCLRHGGLHPILSLGNRRYSPDWPTYLGCPSCVEYFRELDEIPCTE